MTRLLTAEQVEAKSAINRAARTIRNLAGEIKRGADTKKRKPKPSKYRPPVPTEHEEQCAVIDWFDTFAPTVGLDPRLLFAIPNGSNKSIVAAMKFKREGLRKGYPDLGLDVAIGHYNGLRIEMKRVRGSVVSDEQASYHQLLRTQGYRVEVCYGAAQAMAVIAAYLGRA